MEQIIIIMIIGFSFIGSAIIYTKMGLKGSKRAKKTIETFSIDTMTEEFNKMKLFYEDKCYTLEKEMKHWRGRASRLEQIEDNGTGNNGQTGRPTKITANNIQDFYEIDISNGLKLVESMNIPLLNNMDKSKIPDLINNPMIKKKVWSYIKENKDEMIDLGIIIPIGQDMKDNVTTKEVDTKKESSNNGMMELGFDDSNGKYMA